MIWTEPNDWVDLSLKIRLKVCNENAAFPKNLT